LPFPILFLSGFPLFLPQLVSSLAISKIVQCNESSFLRRSFLISQLSLLAMLKHLPKKVNCKWFPLGICLYLSCTTRSYKHQMARQKLAHLLVVNNG
jgi:hypothetical protein